MLKARSLVLAAVTGIAAFSLAACSSDEATEDPTTPEPVAESPVEDDVTHTPEAPVDDEPEPEEEPEPQAPVGDGSEAAPGESFALGETARVNWDSHHSEDGILLDVTVQAVREGNLDDLLALNVSDETAAAIEGHSVHYVDYTITKADQSQPEIAFGNASNGISAQNTSGAELQEFILFGGGFDTCTSNSFGADIDTGAVHESCSIYIVPSGQDFGAAMWGQFGTPYDKFQGEPLTWK